MNPSLNAFDFTEMMQMFMHWDEDSCAQFSNVQCQVFLDHLNGLASEFGKPWVEQLAGVKKTTDPIIIAALGNVNVGDGAVGIMRAVQFSEDWNLLKNSPGATKLFEKLLNGHNNQNVDLEVCVAAAFARCEVEVEFEPILQTGKVSDTRVGVGDGNWFYVEASRRHFSIPELEAAIKTLLELCLKIAPGRRSSLHILGKFLDRNFEPIKSWLEGLVGSQVSNSTLDGIADFRSFDHGADMTTEILISRQGPVETKSLGDFNTSSFATAYYYVWDFGFEKKLKCKREQLPETGHGVVVIDVTGIAGNIKEWTEEALKALQRPDNAHIFAVVILQRLIDAASFPRWRFRANIASNPHIPSSQLGSLGLIERAFMSSST